jgi:diacylglycerol kinase (ATP)
MKYSTIAVIYNPKSTGSSKTLAQKFEKKMHKRMPEMDVTLIPTEYAGHAEELAYSIAKEHTHAIVISSSGDGGYNEVINGALKAQKEGFSITTGLLPAGNANDHFHNIHNDDMVELIAQNKPMHIDVLKMTYKSNKKREHRYAHSYIGFGISSLVGKELNKTKLNRFNELWLLIRTLLTARPVKLKIQTKYEKFDSVIFSNVDKMSKFLNVSDPSRIDDGLFEVTLSKHDTKLKLIALLVKASVVKLKEDRQVSTFKFKNKNETSAQADGEILEVDAKSKVVITSEKQVLTCFV